MGLREMLTLLHQPPDGIPPVTLIAAGQVFAKFSGLRAAEGPCTRGQASTLSWITDTTQYTRMIEWTFDLPDGVTMDDIVAALEVLLERHESLRTTYSRGEPPMQRVVGTGALAVDVFEVTGTIPPGVRGIAMMAGELVAWLRATEFDPEADLPLRVAVAMVAGIPRAAVAVYSHVAADLVAMAVVGRQFTQLAGDRADRAAGPRGHQPLDQAMAERSPAGERRAATALRDWRARLRTMPQLMFALPRGEPGEPGEPREHGEPGEPGEPGEHGEPGEDGVALAGWLLSTAGALALRHIAARTGMRRQAAVLAALCAVLNVRTGQERCVLSALSNNRPERRLQEYVGMITSNTLISVNTAVEQFDDLVRRAATATMAAGRACLADRAEVARVIREVEDERGIIYIRACVFNDATVDEAETSEVSAGDLADVLHALGSTRLRVTAATEIGEPLLLLALMRVDEELVLGALTTDSARVPRADIEALLRAVERLLVAAASADVSMNRVAEITGVGPAVRDETWLLVDSCWVELPEVQRLLEDALPGRGARIFPVQGAGRERGDGDEVALVAYLTSGEGIRTPTQAHAACMTVLRGSGRANPPDGVRFTAMAPARYVICDRSPDDPSDLAAWQRRHVLAVGTGRRYEGQRLRRDRQRQPELAGRIRPPRPHREPGGGQFAFHPRPPELGGHLGTHLLPVGEPDRQADRRDVHDLIRGRAEPHLHPLVPRVPHGDMVERVEVEVRAELGVEHREHVLVERGGHPGGVVVSRHQDSRVLHQVGAQQERVPGPQLRADPGQERRAFLRHHVPDRGAEEGDKPRPRLVTGQRKSQGNLEVRHDRVHLQARVLDGESVPGEHERGLAHVHRHVEPQRPLIAQRVEQQPGLLRRSRAELDELMSAGKRRDLAGDRGQDRALGAGRVVLGEFGDLLEQGAALGIVEPLRRQELRCGAEPGECVRPQGRGAVVRRKAMLDSGQRTAILSV
jgi:hypothetical protein